MSHTEYEGDTAFQSLAERVWVTLKLINIEEFIEQKGERQKFDYLPWAAAWDFLMGAFPESSFEFDEPNVYDNGTSEIWITVTIKDGPDEMTRRWWLPAIDYANKPVINPTSLQINKTRMRVLVKCLAMCGLGTSLYLGEDVPDKDQDVKATGVRAEVLKDIHLLTEEEEIVAQEWIESLREAMPNEHDINQKEVLAIYQATRSLGDMTIKIYNGIESWQRTAITKIRNEIREVERKEAIEKIEGFDDE